MAERRLGLPRSDIERAARHYGISMEEAERKLKTGEITLPPRGVGLETGRAAGMAEGLMPMSPGEGPPLPKMFGLRWPWKK